MGPSGTNDCLAAAAESALVALAMTGDDKAFEELVRRWQGAVRGLLRSVCGDWALADDLAQEAFLKAWQKLRSLKSPGAFGGWLRRIAVNVFLTYNRRGRLPIKDSEQTKWHATSKQEDPAARIDLVKALTRLKPVERLCVVLSYSERMSHSEICSTTGLPLGTVKSHISRGSEQLRTYLKAYKGAV